MASAITTAVVTGLVVNGGTYTGSGISLPVPNGGTTVRPTVATTYSFGDEYIYTVELQEMTELISVETETETTVEIHTATPGVSVVVTGIIVDGHSYIVSSGATTLSLADNIMATTVAMPVTATTYSFADQDDYFDVTPFVTTISQSVATGTNRGATSFITKTISNASATPDTSSKDHHGAEIGMGIDIGVLALLLAAFGMFFFLYRRRNGFGSKSASESGKSSSKQTELPFVSDNKDKSSPVAERTLV